MYDFEYHRASSVDDAAAKLDGASDGTILAGGQTLIPTLKQRLASPSDVIDIGGIGDLKAISAEGGGVTIGAMATHAEVAASDAVRGAIAGLAALAGGIGVVVGVQVIAELFGAHARCVTQEIADVLVRPVELFGLGVDLDAVAGGKQHHFADVVAADEIVQRLGPTPLGHGHGFEDVEGGGAMIQPEYYD